MGVRTRKSHLSVIGGGKKKKRAIMEMAKFRYFHAYCEIPVWWSFYFFKQQEKIINLKRTRLVCIDTMNSKKRYFSEEQKSKFGF